MWCRSFEICHNSVSDVSILQPLTGIGLYVPAHDCLASTNKAHSTRALIQSVLRGGISHVISPDTLGQNNQLPQPSQALKTFFWGATNDFLCTRHPKITPMPSLRRGYLE